jgi:hypothetical protein
VIVGLDRSLGKDVHALVPEIRAMQRRHVS